MAIITTPSNIKDIHNILVTQGFTPPDVGLTSITKSKIDLASEYFSSLNNPDAVLHDAQELVDNSITPEFFNETALKLQTASNSLTSLETHMNGIKGADPGQPGSLGTANLVKNMGISSMEKTRQETLGIAPTNPCDAILGFFGSIMGGLNSVLNTISTAIGSVLDLINDGIAAVIAGIDSIIGPALAAIESAVTAIVETIAKELADFAKAVLDVIDFSHSLSLPNFFKDPCLRAVLEIAGPPELNTALEIADSVTS